jgi:hypothetical protein
MTINIDSSTEVIAAIPALLGFIATNSIVGIVINDDGTQQSILVAARYDSQAPLDVAVRFVDALPLRHDDGSARPVLLIAIADTHAQRLAGKHLDAVRDLLTARGSTVVKRLHVEHLDANHTWVDIDTGQSGQTTDYRTSELTLQMAIEYGRPILSSREDIAAEFATSDPAPAASGTDDTAEFITHTVLGMYAAFTHPEKLTPQLAANAGHLITTSVTHRDVLLIASTSTPNGGATVWTRLARQLRGPARIEALALAAACFYVGDDSLRAGLALDAAHDTAVEADLDDTMLVQLLDTALQSGLPPALVRELFARLTANPPTE